MQKEIKKLTLKEIGIKRLVVMLLCGLALIVISVTELMPEGNRGYSANQSTGSIYKNKNMSDYANEEISGNEIMEQYYNNLSRSREYAKELEMELEEFLSKVDGIGQLEVMITLKESSEQIVLKDEETVIIQKDDNEQPYILKETQPVIEGVVILAQGADNNIVLEEIIGAVEVLFDVPVHKIKVMKMND